jgi:hypothetical protein
VTPPDARDRVRRAILRQMADGELPIVGIATLVPSLDDIYRRALVENGAGGRAA